MHRPVYVAHSSYIEGLHTTKNTAYGQRRGKKRSYDADAGDADLPPLEDGQQKIRADVSNGGRRKSFRQRGQTGHPGSTRW
jgi:hypothetical protein